MAGMLETDGHVVTVATLLDKSGYTEMWQEGQITGRAGRLENLKELLRALPSSKRWRGSWIMSRWSWRTMKPPRGSRQPDDVARREGAGVRHCLLPGWEEGLFPNQRALDEGGVKSLEEERRLAYVGLTRARRRAVVSYAANRRIYTNWQSSIPSRFIEELPDAEVERAGSAALAREAAYRCRCSRGSSPWWHGGSGRPSHGTSRLDRPAPMSFR